MVEPWHGWRTASRSLWVYALVATSLSGAGCQAAPAATESVLVRDSAGVMLVENAAEAEDQAPWWRLSAEPQLRIGTLEGAPEYELSRVVGVTLLGDGTFAVLNSGSYELRFYDSVGVHLRSVGREGSGPGEFQMPASLHRLPGDSLAVFDQRLGNFTHFGPTGDLLDVIRSPVPLGPVGLIDRDRVVSTRTNLAVGLDSPELTRRNQETVESVDLRSGAVRTMIDSLPGQLLFQSAAGGQPSFTRVPFSVGATIRVADGKLYVADSVRPEVRIYDPEGDLLGVVRVLRPVEPVTTEAFNRIAEERLAAVSDPEFRPELRRRYASMSRPESRPAYSDLLVSEVGEIWVRRFQENSGASRIWTVFSADGGVGGAVVLPPRFTPMHIGSDHVVGVRRDDLGVEFVEKYALRRG